MMREEKDNQRRQRTGLEIAVIGMAGRFPGARNINEFWSNLQKGVESICFFTDEELLEETRVTPEMLKSPNFVRAKGYLEDSEYFDAVFFGYTPGEAEIMTPQTRIFHECAWSALEDAGYDPESYNGPIGLYVGASPGFTWEALSRLSGMGAEVDEFSASHLRDKDFLGTRISFKLNLQGPSQLLQTACSTSLVAIDNACRGLLTGICDMALAGGVSVTFPQKGGFPYKEGLVASPDGHCRAFDARSQGLVPGDGVGAVVLKRLEEAIEDKDNIYAVVRGFAVNNDGNNKAGYTAPSIQGQANSIKTAIRMADISAESIGYVETHGTGTKLGDPIEIEALKLAFKTDKKGFCGLGSVKSNVGHLDAAAGVTGFLKTVLALYHRLIPPSLHFEAHNPEIDFTNSPFYVVTEPTEWRNGKYPLRAGVSSFGIGGTNAHVILEEWPYKAGRTAQSTRRTLEREYQLMVLSAKTESALNNMTENLVDYFKQNPGINLSDSAYSLQAGRRVFKYRRTVVCSQVSDFIDALSAPNSRKVQTTLAKDENRPLIFMFSGLGSQYVNMGRELYRKEPIFKEGMDHCLRILEPLTGDDIKSILYPGEISAANPGIINQTWISQIVIFIFEYALARLLMTWGIMPQAMIGYSFGEYAAACIAGVFSLEDALKLVVYRGKLIERIPAGVMLSVPLEREELKPLLSDELSIAIDNGPSCIVAGPVPVVEVLEKQLKKKKYLCMRLKASHAIHSKMMEPILKEFADTVSRIKLYQPQIPYISNVTGKWITHQEAADPAYWSRHLRDTVQFAGGIKELMKTPNTLFLEVGPGRDLSTLVTRYTDKESGCLALNLVRPPQKEASDVYYLLRKLGSLWGNGIKIDWRKFHLREDKYRISLPTYPFEGQRYWVDGNSLEVGAEMLAKRSSRKKADMADWFYIPSWERWGLGNCSKDGQRTSLQWLVFVDGCGLGSKLLKQLYQSAQQVIIVKPGPGFAKISASEFVIGPGNEDDYISLFRELKKLERIPVNILHLWGVEENNGPPGLESIENSLDLGLYSLLYTAKALGTLSMNKELRMVVVTNNMQEVTGDEGYLCPGKAPVVGAVKVIPLEYANIHCRSIDIVIPEPGSKQEECFSNYLIAEFFHESPHRTIAYRGNHRWVEIFKPIRLQKANKTPSRLKQKGVYLITGGFGGMGFTFAGYLATHYQARLILVGRSGFPSKEGWQEWLDSHEKDENINSKIRKLQEFEQMGAEIMVANANVSDLESMQKIINQAKQRFGQINGILHTAGLIDYAGVIQKRNREVTEHVLEPKVKGTLVLEHITKDETLDFFVLFSSIGNIIYHHKFGQVGYNAANEFLDAFAYYKNLNSDRFTVAINWSDWLEVGMAIKAIHKLYEKEEKSNIDYNALLDDAILPQEGVEVLNRIIEEDFPRVAICTYELSAHIKRYSKQNDKDPRIVPAFKDKKSSAVLLKRPELTTGYVPPNNEIQQSLANIWETFFGLERIGIHDDFFELGGDSLKAMFVATRIHKMLDIEIPLAEFFNRPTIEKLAQYIMDNTRRTIYTSIPLVEKKEYYELSSAQKRLFILYQIDSKSTTYNTPTVVGLEGKLQQERINSVFKELIARHETLRTSFGMINGTGVQVIHSAGEVEFELEYHDLANAPAESFPGGQPPERSIIKRFIRPFTLSSPPLLRVGLIKQEESKHIFMVDMHHIISDALSFDIMVRELLGLYRGEKLPQLKIQYKDFSQWQNRWLESEEMKEYENYWLNIFKGDIPRLNMPLDYQRPAVRSAEGDSIYFQIENQLTKKIKELNKESGTTLFMVLLAVYNVLLHKYSGDADIIVGSPVSGRLHADLEGLLGVFVNMIAFRNSPQPGKSFAEFLEEVKKNAVQAYENQDYQFEELVRRLGLQGETGRNPIFDVGFVLQNIEVEHMPGDTNTPGDDLLKVIPCDFENKTSRFDMLLEAGVRGDRIGINLEYSTRLFKRSSMERFLKHYEEILHQVVEKKDIKIGDITVSSYIQGAVSRERNIDFEF